MASNSPSNHNGITRCPQGLCPEDQTMDSHHTHFLSQEALWNKKRKEMLARIAELETQLSQTLPYAAKAKLNSNPHGIYPDKSYGPPLKEKAGNELALGGAGKRDIALATPAFPAAAVHTSSIGGRLSRMAGNAPSGPTATVSDQPDSTKSMSNTSKSATNSSGSHSAQSDPSTDRSSSPRQSPKSLRLPSPPRFPDNHTKDAGHTPLAGAKYNMDAIVSPIDSGPSTPLRQPEQDTAPHESFTSVRRPSERSPSYFPPSSDGDAELKEPLGLKDGDPGNPWFLGEVNSRLREQESLQNSPIRDKSGVYVDPGSLERTPPLRIKTKLNFGSQMGGSYDEFLEDWKLGD
ncbi:MAG: hypothetical protein Q9200_003789 [Gallowayella weberi]